MTEIVLTWRRFEKLTDARDAFTSVPCIYVQTDTLGKPLRVGKASKGLKVRYRGGTGYAMDAAMHNSGNLIFVAEVADGLCDEVEQQLIWRERQILQYNKQGKVKPPSKHVEILHEGDHPRFSNQY